jgi:hypothetical protein
MPTKKERHIMTPPILQKSTPMVEENKAACSKISSISKLLKELGPNDVLLGRGTGPNEYVGNIRFRALVCEVISTSDLATFNSGSKSKLSASVVIAIKERGGRFVKKVSGSSRRREDFYKEVTHAVALGKTKQSFRHQLRYVDPTTLDPTIFNSTALGIKHDEMPGNVDVLIQEGGGGSTTGGAQQEGNIQQLPEVSLPALEVRFTERLSRLQSLHQSQLASLLLADTMVQRDDSISTQFLLSKVANESSAPNRQPSVFALPALPSNFGQQPYNTATAFPALDQATLMDIIRTQQLHY